MVYQETGGADSREFGGVVSRKVSLNPQISIHHFRDSVVSAAGRTGIAPLMIGSMTEG